MSDKYGGPAFASTLKICGCDAQARHQGMTLRDYFAAAALTGLIASPDAVNDDSKIARAVYVYADAMLEARKK